MNDSFGDRYKQYEAATQTTLMARSNMIIRCDGRGFHNYTRNCKKPFDDGLIEAMDKTAIVLCEEVQGAKLGYVQSDEITVWATSYDNIGTNPWFGGNVQKITSIGASVATAAFNEVRFAQWVQTEKADFKTAHFDARVFLVPNLTEVANAFKWRCDDASRNSVQMLARSHFSHKELEGKPLTKIHDMLHDIGINWNDLAPKYKRGRLIKRVDGKWRVCDLTDFTFEYWMGIVDEVKPKEDAD